MSSVSHPSSGRAIGQGSNSVNVRLFNERVILNALRRLGQASSQPAILLSLDPKGAYAIGVRFGRRLTDTLLVDFSGHVLDRGRHPLLSAASLMDVEAIVLDGDLPGPVMENLLDRLGPLLAAAVPEARRAPNIVRGLIGREAGALGASILPLHLNFSPSREVLVN